MRTTLFGLTRPVEMVVVQKTDDDGDTIESSAPVVDPIFNGNLQPLPPRELAIKPEGERNWKWWKLWTEQPLRNDWIVKDVKDGKTFRVKNTADWDVAGYFEYQLVQGPDLES